MSLDWFAVLKEPILSIDAPGNCGAIAVKTGVRTIIIKGVAK